VVVVDFVAFFKSKRRSRAQRLAQVNLLELAPVRRAPWTVVEGRVVIERPQPAERLQLGEWMRYWLAVRRVRLDDRGSCAWQLLDGRHSVAEVATALRREFGDSVEPAEDRAGELIRMLHSEGLVAYPGWDEDRPCEEGTGSQSS
jgi:hypothetical protein